MGVTTPGCLGPLSFVELAAIQTTYTYYVRRVEG